jgi:ATP-dependent Zn protease
MPSDFDEKTWRLFDRHRAFAESIVDKYLMVINELADELLDRETLSSSEAFSMIERSLMKTALE